ncbi:MAG: non-canonical purine NTP pyrophosphatase, RdgB/HAM1 family [Euryarchaeota archaeon]|nr:non-canonical purine NTP pyrophosphatase, RdgB/HAM1 family [Euryarchaeota archaeon]
MVSEQMEILFATGNKNKVSEASEIFSKQGLKVLQLELEGLIPEFVEPQSDDIEEVALSKIDQAREMVRGTQMEKSAILVEDSGLFVDSLDGFPGPYSSYVERTIGLRGILDLLKLQHNRDAEFRALAAISFDGKIITALGSCSGIIANTILGESGFGYDPIFIPHEGDGRTCGEMTKEEKSQISHRGRALKAVSELLIPPSK